MRKILLFFTFLAVCSFNLLAQLVIDFSADMTEGCVPLTVDFTDLSTSNGTITSWEWSFGNGNNSTQQNPTHIYSTAASTFEVCLTVTDDLSQTDTHCKTAFITTYDQPIAEAGSAQELNCVTIQVTLDGSGSSTGPGIQYEWLDPNGTVISLTLNPTVSVPGEYTLIVTNEEGCTASDGVIIAMDIDTPVADIVASSLCSYPYNLSAENSSTGTNIAYEWYNPGFALIGTDINTQVSEAGSYTLIVTNVDNGCSSSVEIEVFPPDPIIIEEETPVQHISCIGADDGAIDIMVFGGTPPYMYLWSNGESTEDISNLPPGVYTVTVTDLNGCIQMAVKTVTEPAPLTISPFIEEVLCPGACDGVITLVVSGGCGSYSYLWSNGVVEPQVIGLCDAGTYDVTVTDCNGCTIVESIILPEAPQPMVLDFVTTCPTSTEGGSIDLSVSGGSPPYLYLWHPGFATTSVLVDLGPGIYTVTVEDSNGCTIEESIELGDGIENVIGGDTVYCDGDQIQLFVDAPDAVTYNWVPSDQLSCSDCPDPVLTVDLGGNTTYLVSIVESDGCIDEALITFSVQSYLDFNLLEFSNSPVIEGNELELYCNVLNPISVEWTGPGNFNSLECTSVITSADIGNEGEYSLDIIDEYGCEATATTDVNILTIIDSISENSTICAGGSVELLVVAPDALSVMWTPAVGLDDPNVFNPLASPSITTTYTVTVEDGLGNQESLSVTITVEQEADLQVLGNLEICEGAILDVCANQNLQGTYLWTGPNGFATTEPCFTILDFPVDMAGCYTLIYTSPNGCETTETVCITVLELPIITIGDLQICAGESTELDLGLSPSFTYLWSPATGLSCTDCPNPIASPVMTTAYTVIIVTPSGCEAMAIIEIEVEQGCVWPGDTDTSKVVDNFDLLNIGLAYDSIGPVRPDATIGWYGQPGPDWLQTHPGIDANFKHIDTNGDGTINSNDTLAIIQNWGEFHNFTDEDPDAFSQTVSAPFYVEPDTLIEGESHVLSVILGDMNDGIDELYGLAFSLEYDPEVIVPGSASMAFNAGWIGTKGLDMIVIQKTFIGPGRVDVGITRIDGQNRSGFGEIGQFYITIEDDILFQSGDEDSRGVETIDAKFKISNVRLINNLGEVIPVNPQETIAVVDEVVGTKQLNWEQYIQVQPNPANAEFFITSKNIKLSKIDLYKLTGEKILTRQAENSTMKVNTQNLIPGIYLLKVQTDRGEMVKRVAILR